MREGFNLAPLLAAFGLRFTLFFCLSRPVVLSDWGDIIRV
jgi:hypothetical protein